VILHERTLAGFGYKSERLGKEFRIHLIVFSHFIQHHYSFIFINLRVLIVICINYIHL